MQIILAQQSHTCFNFTSWLLRWTFALDLLMTLEDQQLTADVVSYTAAIGACDWVEGRCWRGGDVDIRISNLYLSQWGCAFHERLFSTAATPQQWLPSIAWNPFRLANWLWRLGPISKDINCHMESFVDGRNPAPVEVGTLSRYLQGFIDSRWLFGISEPSTVSFIRKFSPRLDHNQKMQWNYRNQMLLLLTFV